MSRIIKPVLSQFEIEVDVVGPNPAWDPQAEMSSSDQLCGARLLSRDVQSIEATGATTVTRVRQETVDDD
jgi:aspartate carbamoyltransferase catalytic subunit